MQIISLVIGLAIAFGALSGAFLPQLAGWADDVSNVNSVSYAWVVYLIAMVVIFALLLWAVRAIGYRKK